MSYVRSIYVLCIGGKLAAKVWTVLPGIIQSYECHHKQEHMKNFYHSVKE